MSELTRDELLNLQSRYGSESAVGKAITMALRNLPAVPREPTEAMLNAARNGEGEKNG